MGHPHYSRAPITEAIIDLRVSPAKGADSSVFDSLTSSLKESFPHQSPIFQGQLQVAISPKTPPSVDSKHTRLGTRLADGANSRILQVTTLGFTYSHLPPYTNWETFRTEALSLWKRYLAALQPEQVNRIAVRYINRLDLPGPKIEESDYLTLYPHLPAGVSQDMIGMFMQVRIPQSDINDNAIAVLNTSLLNSDMENVISLLLDIDVFIAGMWVSTDQAIVDLLEQIRDRKNILFNACLTERAKELYR